ncbi:MAG TPA: serine/threonine-protein kinase [Planctomycetota bacterium]|nr:serine/threonine-protein kinase [Planctomycetota bacterium]
MDPAATPTEHDLQAYREGRLDLSRFEAVDRWLAAQPPEEQERLLAGGDEAVAMISASALDTAGAQNGCFTPEGGARSRFRGGPCIGQGGMGIVEAVFDVTLGREVALKRCRPRRVDEDMGLYATRLRVFRREAQVTAQLEHPGIVPVHDVGTGPHGEPAFTMKRLDGEPMTAMVGRRRDGGATDVAQVVELLLRIAEAVAYAHRRGVVHRDLKPDNVIVGALGAAYVIDWGLAGRVGALPVSEREAPPDAARSEHGLGTPAWMAPEQFHGAAADPRMDVFALGGLLMAALTGVGPRDLVRLADGGKLRANDLDLSPLDQRGLPRGLVAVARRCLSRAPGDRYGDGEAVAADLRGWLSLGLTSAEHAGPLTRAWTAFRRSPRAGAAVIAGSLALIILIAGFLLIERRERRRRDQATAVAVERLKKIEDEAFARLAQTKRDDADETSEALGELRDARDRAGEIATTLPDPAPARSLEHRLDEAIVAVERELEQTRLRERLLDLANSYRIKGRWPSEADELAYPLRLMGLRLEPGALEADAAVLDRHPHRDVMLQALVQLQRAQLLGSTVTPPLDDFVPDLIEAVARNDGWRALAELLRHHPHDLDHDLTLPDSEFAETALRSPSTADLMLATFGPDPRLDALAHRRLGERLEGQADYFWPRVVAARAAFNDFEYVSAERHALVALGIAPSSMWPRLILSYVALVREDWRDIDEYLDPVIRAGYNPRHLEVNALKAAALAKQGKREEASEALARCAQVGQLRYHQLMRTRHPLDRVAKALQEAGVAIPENPVLKPAVAPPEAPTPPVPRTEAETPPAPARERVEAEAPAAEEPMAEPPTPPAP